MGDETSGESAKGFGLEVIDTKNRTYELLADHARLGKSGEKFSAWRYGTNLAWVTGQGPIVNYSDIDKLVEEGKVKEIDND